MLETKGLLEALSKKETMEGHKNHNEDYDLHDVFEFLCGNTI